MLKVILIFLLSLYLIGGVLLYIFQRNLLYFPSAEYEHQLEQFDLLNEGERLKVVVLNPNRPQAIIYFGGNAEPVVFNEEPFKRHFPNHTVYLMNYRGYGGSSGTPSEVGLLSDALTLYDHVSKDHDSIFVFGRSLGSGVATYLAAERKVHGLVLVTPYDSIVSVAQKRFPFYPVAALLKDHYNSKERAQNVSAPVLIIMAELDAVIPNWHTLELKKSFSGDKANVIKIIDTDHNNVSFSEEYFEALIRFLDN